MRAAPALQVTVTRRGAWRWVVVALAATSFSALAAWIGSRLVENSLAMPVGICMASALAAVMAWRALKPAPLGLRFDGQCWHLLASAPFDESGRPGDVTVVMDLGLWMLLRFDAHAGEMHERCRRWLAVDRHELRAQWHGLRCAVYSPRPGVSSASREAPADPPLRE